MRVGIIELLLDTIVRSRKETIYAGRLRKQFSSVTPQAVAVWCRQLGHQAFYATYYGQDAPERLLPGDLDIVFVAACTDASSLAYALGKIYRRRGIRTVIGGPHAKSFPRSCLQHFDIVVKNCDKALVDEILRGQFDPPAIADSGRQLTDFPSVEERLPEIVAASFSNGRPTLASTIALLASVGCPYSCNFCTDWSNGYHALPQERLAADLGFISEFFPGVMIAYHDPNFAIRFDETMDVIEAVPEGRRNRYVMESSLSVLKESRLDRLRRTNCFFVAPGVESWADYSNKTATTAKQGREKLEQVADHFALLHHYVPGLQANFIFGADADRGREPVELTKEFVRRLPYVWTNVNIPTPYGATPLYDQYMAEGRILRSMPIELCRAPYLMIVPAHYDPLEYHDHVIDLYGLVASARMLTRRLAAEAPLAVRLAHILRTLDVRSELAELRRVRDMMATDPWFRAFHEGRSLQVPEYYHWRYEQRLGRYAELVPRAERVPEHEAPSLSPCAPTPTPSPDHGSLTSRPRGKPPLMIPALASS